MKKRNNFLLPLILIALFTSCSETGSEPENVFERGLILQNVAANLVLPSLEELVNETAELEVQVKSFNSTPNEQNLAALQEAWLAAKLAWKKAEIFNFGPVEPLAPELNLDSWPTNPSGIEESISTDQAIDQAYVKSQSQNRKGFSAMEYLVFSGEDEEVVNEFTANQDRRDYLLALSLDIRDQAEEIQRVWVASGGNYARTFVGSVGNSVGSSINLLANEMIFLLEVVKNFKIATPVGLRTAGEIQPELVEAPFSEKSLAFAKENMAMIEQVYLGEDGMGFDDYLAALEVQGTSQLLSEEIASQIQACQNALEAIQPSIEEAILSDPEMVKQAFAELQKLTTLMKTDMMSALSLTITFSDNDGD